ncbi:hypothetical protein C8R43DRAFT_1128428 [Mycena crocata]|nr:hypothetical protein C8R43DRAFT_1128428 [Mycena crocata]
MKDRATPFVTLPTSFTFRVSSQFLSGNLALPLLWDFHQENSGSHPLFIYSESDGTTTNLLWSQGLGAMRKTASFLKPHLRCNSASRHDGPVVVGILSFRDVPTSWAIITAVLRLGATAFLISPTNTPTTLATLLKDSKCDVVVTSGEEPIEYLVQTAQSLMDGDFRPAVIRGPSYHDLYLSDMHSIEPSELPAVIEIDSPALIMHSSGSSGSPSLIISSHRTLVHGSMVTYFGETDLCGGICGSESFPLYHNTGFAAHIALPSAVGQVASIFNPNQEAKSATPDSVLASAEMCGASYLYTVPSFLEMFAGSPLKTHVGNHLANHGVRLSSMYGSSECGAISTIAFEPEDWEYIAPTRQTTVLWELREGAETLFEPVVLESAYKRIAKTNTTRNGVPACKTGDLFEKHPTKEDLWRMYGRADTLIVHSTGKNAKSIISKHPLVKYALVFGHGQPHAGVLIWPHAADETCEKDTSVQNLCNAIWPAIEEANKISLSHSRIVKEAMIIGTTKPFSVTDKHSLRRAAILADYTEEISAVFRALNEAT